ncbi:MAG TPA: glycerol-3-phosphate 1-O-acyltransferase PlsY [Myxococcaceae bacterium]
MTAQAPLLVALAYLLGSIPFGVLITRWKLGVDVRAQGSGNIGATNVARVGGKKLGVLVLVLDALKGAGPAWAAVFLMPGERWAHAAVALAAFLGHVFPPWLKFKGGKGVATAMGVLLVLEPVAAVCGFLVYAVLFAVWRVSSVGSLVAGAVATAGSWLGTSPREYATLTTVLMAMMLYTHRGNIRRIAQRTEKPI